MLTTNATAVAALYQAFFNRPADPEGLAYWTAQLDAGASLVQIAEGFGGSAEFRALYLTGGVVDTSPQGQIVKAYSNIFERAPDGAGAVHWIGQLNEGQPLWSVIFDMLHAADYGRDALKLENTITVSLYFTEAIAAAGVEYDVDMARQFVDGVGFTPTSIQQAIGAINQYIQMTLNPPKPGEPEEPEPSTPAIIGGDLTGSVREADDIAANPIHVIETFGQLTVIDPDPGEAAFIAGVYLGEFGSITLLEDGAWHYEADNRQTAIQILDDGESITDTITIQSLDGTTADIEITIDGRNEPVSGSMIITTRFFSDGTVHSGAGTIYDASAQIENFIFAPLNPTFLLDVDYNTLIFHGIGNPEGSWSMWSAGTLEVEFSAISTIHAARIVDDLTWFSMADPVLSIDGNTLTIQLVGIYNFSGPWNFELDWIA